VALDPEFGGNRRAVPDEATMEAEVAIFVTMLQTRFPRHRSFMSRTNFTTTT